MNYRDIHKILSIKVVEDQRGAKTVQQNQECLKQPSSPFLCSLSVLHSTQRRQSPPISSEEFCLTNIIDPQPTLTSYNRALLRQALWKAVPQGPWPSSPATLVEQSSHHWWCLVCSLDSASQLWAWSSYFSTPKQTAPTVRVTVIGQWPVIGLWMHVWDMMFVIFLSTWSAVSRFLIMVWLW